MNRIAVLMKQCKPPLPWLQKPD